MHGSGAGNSDKFDEYNYLPLIFRVESEKLDSKQKQDVLVNDPTCLERARCSMQWTLGRIYLSPKSRW